MMFSQCGSQPFGARNADFALVTHRGAGIAGGAQINHSGVLCEARPRPCAPWLAWLQAQPTDRGRV